MSATTDKARPVAWLSPWLNDGKRSGFKPGDKIEVSDQRGVTLVGEVWGKGEKAGDLWVVVDGRTYDVRPRRPTCVADLKARTRVRRPVKRDALGRFSR